jgi:molybdopterin molybdotransferase
MRDADILILIGGASVGDRDFSQTALASLGLSLVFSKVAMKPGKPVWYGRVGNIHVLGLPGNPTAALVTARLFLVPLLCGLLGRPLSAALPWRSLALAASLAAGEDRETFFCGVAEADGGTVRAVDRQRASGQASIATANVLIRGPAKGPARMIGDFALVLDF